MILQIKLMSDLCVSSGETYNSFVDTEIVYESNGLPYIPAKRIKGCIREAALELVEFGICKEVTYQHLFGREGKENTLFSLDNAYVKNYKELVADLKSCSDRDLVHPQRVLNLYTYTRTQTAMTKDGVADKGSLRTMRVVNKDMVFEASLQMGKDITEEEQELLVTAVSMVKHIGLGRTRGLGQVEMSLLEGSKETCAREAGAKEEKKFEIGEQNKVRYAITLEAPVLCKSATGSQEKSHDYIEGSKVLGILASRMTKEEFSRLMSHEAQGDGILVSNAYISVSGERCTPARASLQKVKDQTFDETGCMVIEDMLFAQPKEEQYTPIGVPYLYRNNAILTVEMETNYHHRRPNNKAIGKADGTDDSSFYQLESIQKGQEFTGYILANREQTEVVIRALQQAADIRIGYSRNAEYGKARLQILGVEQVLACEEKAKEFVVKLNSPVILYNQNGIPSADVTCLKSYISDCLGIPEDSLELANCCLTYETIGGFNVTWNRRKPIFTALGKGTVCHFKCTEEVNIAPLRSSFLGERVSEGYGEVEASISMEPQVILRKDLRIKVSEQEAKEERTSIISEIKKQKKFEEISYEGVSAAKKILEINPSLFRKKEFKSALGKLILITKSEKTISGIEEQISGIEQDDKKNTCNALIKHAKAFPKGGNVDWEDWEQTQVYLKHYLNHIKYVTYKKEGNQYE